MGSAPGGNLVMCRREWGDGVIWFFANNSAPMGPIGMKFGQEYVGGEPNLSFGNHRGEWGRRGDNGFCLITLAV